MRHHIRICLAAAFIGACAPPADKSVDNLAQELAAMTNTASAAREQPEDRNFSQASLKDFAGYWESISDDGTKIETADIDVSDGNATGILKSLERGYFSGRVTVTGEATIHGTLRGGALDLRVSISDNGSENTATGRAMRRGEYLIVRVGPNEQAYARKGVSLVKSAQGSTDAQRLSQAVLGHIYSTSSSAAGRGAFVGGRVRLALCSDGSIAFDASDLATTGGYNSVDMGSSVSRRGQWSIVLFAGAPVVRAEWNGTGTSYSLTRYFRIEPDTRGAIVDGTPLPESGTC